MLKPHRIHSDMTVVRGERNGKRRGFGSV